MKPLHICFCCPAILRFSRSRVCKSSDGVCEFGPGACQEGQRGGPITCESASLQMGQGAPTSPSKIPRPRVSESPATSWLQSRAEYTRPLYAPTLTFSELHALSSRPFAMRRVSHLRRPAFVSESLQGSRKVPTYTSNVLTSGRLQENKVEGRAPAPPIPSARCRGERATRGAARARSARQGA